MTSESEDDADGSEMHNTSRRALPKSKYILWHLINVTL